MRGTPEPRLPDNLTTLVDALDTEHLFSDDAVVDVLRDVPLQLVELERRVLADAPAVTAGDTEPDEHTHLAPSFVGCKIDVRGGPAGDDEDTGRTTAERRNAAPARCGRTRNRRTRGRPLRRKARHVSRPAARSIQNSISRIEGARGLRRHCSASGSFADSPHCRATCSGSGSDSGDASPAAPSGVASP